MAKSLIRISDLTDAEILRLCRTAIESPPAARHVNPALPAVGLLFTEPSTRTRISFERAAQRLGRSTILVDAKTTSLEKGETMADTLLNLRALGVGTFVIRTPETGSLEELRAIEDIGLVNAGDGIGEHPTQALLDFATILAARGGDVNKLQGLKLGILGDLKRSRVARSWSQLAPRFGIELVLISPGDWKPDWMTSAHRWTDDKRSALGELDILMALRIQKERMVANQAQGTDDFVRRFHVSAADLHPRQKLMHPGPVNWGIELAEDLKSDPRSLILAQVEMGLGVRSAVLEFLTERN
ncbi:MAG: hypothetical protein JST16_09580 [Bdellovibrionales bacterium]|nr:hypothetical protein [Bdellovibrionales bacterium]